MKTKVITALIATIFFAAAVPAIAKPATLAVPMNQAQFQWRAPSWGGPIGAWSSIYQNYATSMDLVLTGDVLHTTLSYSPSVTDLEGASTVYVYDKTSGLWIQHEGTISYTSPYSGLTITEYWRGYLRFTDTPSDTAFVHGVGYQWGYVYGVDEVTVKASYPYAVWDETMGAWLVGFSIYLWDPTTYTQAYTIPFPSPFIEPVPASNYNLLEL
jgi:hypothetical protein